MFNIVYFKIVSFNNVKATIMKHWHFLLESIVSMVINKYQIYFVYMCFCVCMYVCVYISV